MGDGAVPKSEAVGGYLRGARMVRTSARTPGDLACPERGALCQSHARQARSELVDLARHGDFNPWKAEDGDLRGDGLGVCGLAMHDECSNARG